MKKFPVLMLGAVSVLALTACGGTKKVSYETYSEKAAKAFVKPEDGLGVKVTYSVEYRGSKDADFQTRGETRYGIAADGSFTDGFYMAATDVPDPADPAGGAEMGATYTKNVSTFYVNPFKAVYEIEATASMESSGMVMTMSVIGEFEYEFNSKGWLVKSSERSIQQMVMTMGGETLEEQYEEDYTIATLEYGHFE